MKVPASMIVLPLLLAVPFGLAIRDSIKGNDPDAREAAVKKKQAELEEKEANERAAAEQAQYEREKKLAAQRSAALAKLIGPEVATMGAAVSDQQLGELTNLPDSKLPALDPDLEQSVLGRDRRTGMDDKVIEVSVELASDTVCRDVRTLIVGQWGPGEQLWIDRAQHRRASLVPLPNGGCRLNFDRFVEDAAWVQSALPKLLGKSRAQVTKYVGDGEDPTGRYVAGPPAGLDVTHLSIVFGDDDKVERVQARLAVTDEEAAAIVKAISEKLGSQPADDYGSYRWGKHTTFSYDATHLVLTQEL